MKKIITTLFVMLSAGCVLAQNIAGTWYGALNVQGTKLHIVFHITKSGDSYMTTMDSPDQNAKGIATDKTTVAGNSVTIELQKAGIRCVGTYSADSNKITGTFNQGAMALPLVLSSQTTETGKAERKARPQDPVDFPYSKEEVSFTNPKDGDVLAGTLTMPRNGKASRIVIMITGSGPQNRDEELVQFNHRPFLVWSDWLTRNGIAVLRFDDRGVGSSTGIYGKATSADFADDVEAAVSYIRSRGDLKGMSIGLMGHSEGGMIAPMVASRDKDIKFLVLLAGPGIPSAQLMLQQNADQARLAGASAEEVANASAINKKIYTDIGEWKDLPVDTLNARLLAAMRSAGGTDEAAKAAVVQLSSPWFRYFITFDPAPYLAKTKCPVLAMNGTLDMQVEAKANLAGIAANLKKAGNKNVTIVPLDGMNHLFQKATTGSVEEYGSISETVDPIALKKVTDWINTL